MDITKIRKKLKDTGQQSVTEPRAESGAVPRKAEEFEPPETPLRREAQAEKEDIKTGAEGTGSRIELLTFIIGKEEYAFRIGEIMEIVRPQRITRIPNAKQFLLGITSLRGKIIPVIDLKMMLSLDGKKGEGDKKQKIMMLKGPKGPVGVVIDRVGGVIRPSISEIVETPPHLPEAEMKFIEGVAIVEGRFISIIRTEEAVNI